MVCAMIRAGLSILCLAALGPAALAADREWPSSRFRDGPHVPPPCTCRGPGSRVELGQEICLATPNGPRRARCVMVENVTSWAMSDETCGATTFRHPPRGPRMMTAAPASASAPPMMSKRSGSNPSTALSQTSEIAM